MAPRARAVMSAGQGARRGSRRGLLMAPRARAVMSAGQGARRGSRRGLLMAPRARAVMSAGQGARRGSRRGLQLLLFALASLATLALTPPTSAAAQGLSARFGAVRAVEREPLVVRI